MSAWRVEEAHLRAAREAIRAHCRPTPLIPAPAPLVGHLLKPEHRQITGSFKVRGALARVGALTEEERARGVLTASAGNHGLGLAYAARAFGVEARVYVARSAPKVKKEGIRALGATLVEVEAKSYDEVEAAAKAAAAAGPLFLSPFDDPWIAAGNGGTLVEELLEEAPELAAILVPVGGGGLLSGIAAALLARGRSDLRLIGVQSEACPSMAVSLAEGRARLAYDGAPTLAEGLQGGISDSTFGYARERLDRMEIVSEEAIGAAMAFAKRSLGDSIEGSAAVTLAYALENRASLPRPTVILLSGGNVDPELIADLEAKF